MDDLRRQICRRTSSEFQMLVNKVAEDVDQQLEICEKIKKVDELNSQLKKLKKRKMALMSKSAKDFCVPSCCQQILIEAVKVELTKNSQYILSAQRHAGITAEILYPGKMKFHFETSYKGKYLTTFTWELLIRNKTLETCYHNIPTFIPMTAYVEKYNRSEIKLSEMVRGVHNFLISYIRRREQIVECVDSFPKYVEDVKFSKACDLIQLKVRIPGEKNHIIIQLIYNNFCSSLPSSVRCGVPDRLYMDKTCIKNAFKTLPIIDAYRTAFKDFKE